MIAAFRGLLRERDWILDHSTREEPSLVEAQGPRDQTYLRRRAVAGVLVVQGVLAASALLCGFAQIMTLGHARRFCLNHVAPLAARTVMRLLAIELRFSGFEKLPQPCVVIANHSSTLDLFVVAALPISNLRSFMARWVQIFPPLAVLSRAMGIFLTPPQTQRQARVELFRRAEAELRASGDSVYLSPEGKRRTDGGLHPFNRGAFHLAAALGWPIVPVYIQIPRRINPGVGYATRPGLIQVRARPAIDTSEWEMTDIDQKKDDIRELYLGFPRGWETS